MNDTRKYICARTLQNTRTCRETERKINRKRMKNPMKLATNLLLNLCEKNINVFQYQQPSLSQYVFVWKWVKNESCWQFSIKNISCSSDTWYGLMRHQLSVTHEVWSVNQIEIFHRIDKLTVCHCCWSINFTVQWCQANRVRSKVREKERQWKFPKSI